MKTKLPLIAALCCSLSSVGSAFTLDFSGLTVGDTLPQTINVLGYGDVSFTPTNGVLEIDTFEPGAVNAVGFDVGDSLRIDFLGNTPIWVANQYIEANVGENFNFDPTVDPNVFLLSFSSGDITARAGLQSVIFDQVPEPSSALLGALSASLLVLRRRR